MTDPSLITLLREALQFLNDRPNFALRHDPQATSYVLAARIDRHLAALPLEPENLMAVQLAKLMCLDIDGVAIDHDENEVRTRPEGFWVRAWVLVDRATLPADSAPLPPIEAEAFRAAVMALPEPQ